MSETWRVFCAVDLPLDLKDKLAAHTNQLRRSTDFKASWTRPDNIHLTIKFLGEVPAPDVVKLSNAAARATKPLSPFKLAVEQTGAFPSCSRPRVLWIGITDSDKQLARLQIQLEDECAIEGFPKETRPFHPHLTLARIRHAANAGALGTAHRSLMFEPLQIEVSELLVIRSELGKEGSKYTPISRHPLGQTLPGDTLQKVTGRVEDEP